MDNKEIEKRELNPEELDAVAGGSDRFLVLTRINHCDDPRGRCRKSLHEDKKHCWSSYKGVYVCEFCEQWAHPSEL